MSDAINNEELRAILTSMSERQKVFSEQLLRHMQELSALRYDYQVKAAEDSRRWADSERRWADTQTDIRELMFENQCILRFLEKQLAEPVDSVDAVDSVDGIE